MEREPTYHLEGVIRSKAEMADFEGPLALILMLLNKNKIAIRDIQISRILEQYLAYLENMKALDLDVASEFIQMAAHLLYLKTKTLLAAETESVGEMELLVSSLEQIQSKDVYSAIQEVCPWLEKASAYGMRYHSKMPEPLPPIKTYRYQHEPWELLQALLNIPQRGVAAGEIALNDEERRFRQSLVPKRIIYPVHKKSREILRTLSGTGRLPLQSFYSGGHNRSEVVATFISVLELCSMGHTRLLREGTTVYVEFTGDDVEEVIASIPE